MELQMWIFGTILPFLGWRRIPLNRDGSIYDLGEIDMTRETDAPFYTDVFAFEWLGFGFSFGRETPIMDARTHKPLT